MRALVMAAKAARGSGSVMGTIVCGSSGGACGDVISACGSGAAGACEPVQPVPVPDGGRVVRVAINGQVEGEFESGEPSGRGPEAALGKNYARRLVPVADARRGTALGLDRRVSHSIRAVAVVCVRDPGAGRDRVEGRGLDGAQHLALARGREAEDADRAHQVP